MARFFFHFVLSVATFSLGVIGVSFYSVDSTDRPDQILSTFSPTVEHFKGERSTDDDEAQGSCGSFDHDEIDLTPILVKWMSVGVQDGEPYCASTGEMATGAYIGLQVVVPTLIDLNNDGVDEIALEYHCSPTGNCSMDIFHKYGRSYRQIFRDRQMVSKFELLEKRNKGFAHIQTRSHGSCCSGDQVTYRYDGRKYRPISCAEYSYFATDGTPLEGSPAITNKSCRTELDSQ